MTALIIIIIVIIIVVGRSYLSKTSPKTKRDFTYRYSSKKYLMTAAENEFFDTLLKSVGDSYYVFPQVHLSAFLYKSKGQAYWRGAQDYIEKMSVDYIICDKKYRKPLLAIELDDKTHDLENRKKRDADVERILANANLPLLRFRDVRDLPDTEIIRRINSVLTRHPEYQPSKIKY